MNYAIILSGGIGSRMKMDGFPKQYLEVNGKPILVYTLEIFQKNSNVDVIVVVAAKEWEEQIQQWAVDFGLTKVKLVAPCGASRQESIRNGLKACITESVSDEDNVIIHDAVRPLLSDELISKCFRALSENEGCMPVIPVNDTVYQSRDGEYIESLLNRDTLFAGQAPEAFNLLKYYNVNKDLTESELEKIRGTSEIAYRNNMKIRLIPGEERNFKITTQVDLRRFEAIIGAE